jgi:DNA mismatch repair protein MutS2
VRSRLGDLVAVGSERTAPAPRPAAEPGDASAPAELMLLGRRVEEALDEIDDFLDRGLRAGLREARIVHGHGTGRLRDAIREHLRRHPAVATYRAGAPNEGGNGATVVALRV